jgi:hypothetical protein
MMEVQSTLYYYVLSKFFNNDRVMGIVFNYIRTKPPTIPKLLKNGQLSKKKIDTDRSTYMATIKKYGLDPKDYEDILNRLSYRDWFVRERVPRPIELVRKVISEAVITGHLIEAYKQKTLLPDRTILKSCQWDCEFQPLCYADLHGHDTEYLIKTMYEPRKEESSVKEEKIQE